MADRVEDLGADLLLTLEALLEDSSVTQAALRLGVTQPALSARLARLRRLFNDRLFVPSNSGRGLVATERALALGPAVRDVIDRMRGLLAEERPFDPTTSARTFVVAMHDNPAAMLVADLVSRVTAAAPKMRVAFVLPETSSAASKLETGSYDLLVGGTRTEGDLKSRTLFDEDLLTAQRCNHPRGDGPLDLDAFCAADHLLISADGGGFQGSVDDVLAAMGRRRRVAVSIQSYALAPHVVAQSDLLCTLPRRFLQRFGTSIDLFEPPLDLGRFTLSAFWHARSQDDPGHMWLRNQIFLGAASKGRTEGPSPIGN